MKIHNLPRIKKEEIGFYLRLIKENKESMTSEQYAESITEEFNLYCTKEDIEEYNLLHIELEDYEKISRMQSYNTEHFIE